MRPGAHKYRAQRTEYNGRSYASKAEAKRAWELDMLKRGGQVAEWIAQPRFQLGCPENLYVADFLVVWVDGSVVVEDIKGMETAAFAKNRRLWLHYGRLPLRILKAYRQAWKTETITPVLLQAGKEPKP